MNKWLEFREVTPPATRKTKVVLVYSKQGGYVLGTIKWFGRWRQYAFFPDNDTAWNPNCLEAVIAEIARLTKERLDR